MTEDLLLLLNKSHIRKQFKQSQLSHQENSVIYLSDEWNNTASILNLRISNNSLLELSEIDSTYGRITFKKFQHTSTEFQVKQQIILLRCYEDTTREETKNNLIKKTLITGQFTQLFPLIKENTCLTMGCSLSAAKPKNSLKLPLNNSNLQKLVHKYNESYSLISTFRFQLYEDLEIPHFVDELNEKASFTADEILIYERLLGMKTIYSSEYYDVAAKRVKEQFSKLRRFGQKLIMSLEQDQRVVDKFNTKMNLPERTQSLLAEIQLKNNALIGYFRNSLLDETKTTLARSRSNSEIDDCTHQQQSNPQGQ